MATDINGNAREITLEDGTRLTIKSLPIKLLRKFMNEWNTALSRTDENGEAKPALDDDGFLDLYIRLNGIALSRQLHHAGKVETIKQYDNPREFSGMTSEYFDYLEENVDVPNSELILEICGGIKDDPKLAEAVMESLNQGDGTN